MENINKRVISSFSLIFYRFFSVINFVKEKRGFFNFFPLPMRYFIFRTIIVSSIVKLKVSESKTFNSSTMDQSKALKLVKISFLSKNIKNYYLFLYLFFLRFPDTSVLSWAKNRHKKKKHAEYVLRKILSIMLALVFAKVPRNGSIQIVFDSGWKQFNKGIQEDYNQQKEIRRSWNANSALERFFSRKRKKQNAYHVLNSSTKYAKISFVQFYFHSCSWDGWESLSTWSLILLNMVGDTLSSVFF